MNRACEQELNELVGLGTSPTYMGPRRAPANTSSSRAQALDSRRVPANTSSRRASVETTTRANQGTLNSGDAMSRPDDTTYSGDAFMDSGVPVNISRPEAGDASMDQRAPSGTSGPRGLYCWGVTGHDLASIYADQRDHYHTVMTTTAGPATSLDLGGQFRGPSDTILEEVPEAVLYKHPTENESIQEVNLTWVDENFGDILPNLMMKPSALQLIHLPLKKGL